MVFLSFIDGFQNYSSWYKLFIVYKPVDTFFFPRNVICKIFYTCNRTIFFRMLMIDSVFLDNRKVTLSTTRNILFLRLFFPSVFQFFFRIFPSMTSSAQLVHNKFFNNSAKVSAGNSITKILPNEIIIFYYEKPFSFVFHEMV